MRAAVAAKRESAKKYMTDRGLSPSLLPKAVFVHEMLGLCMLAITWSIAYRFPPSEMPLLSGPITRISSAIPQQISWLNSKGGRSYIEASCCRKLIRPITIPGKLYLTFAIMSNLDSFIVTGSAVAADSSVRSSGRKSSGFIFGGLHSAPPPFIM